MKKKILTITYTCPEDKVNLGEAEIMGYALQQLGKIGAYDINMKAGSLNLAEPVVPKAPEMRIEIPEFMRKKEKANLPESLRLVGEGEIYGETV